MIKSLVYFLLVSLLIISCSEESSLYEIAKELNTVEGYEDFLSKFREGEYSDDAREKISELKFNELRDSVFISFLENIDTNQTLDHQKIIIKPSSKILMGTPIDIDIRYLPPGKNVTLHAYRRQWSSLLYSFAEFVTDSLGTLDLKKSKPISGTYNIADSLGIFWSMTRPYQQNIDFPFKISDLKQNAITLSLEIDDQLISSRTLELIEKLPNVESQIVKNDTLTAVYHHPESGINLPAVILLSGSEGGYNNVNKMARIIASHGYATIALAYFKIDPLPEFLENIPLEYFFGAIEWLKNQPEVDPENIVVAGGSRGGELALLLASLKKDIAGVIAVEPSCVLWQGLPHSIWTVFFTEPAWTLNGEELPYLDHNLHLPTLVKFGDGSRQINLMKLYEDILEDKEDIEEALIRVENINGPILLIAGKKGELWPSYQMCKMMEQRLDTLNFGHSLECRYYENAGHYVTITPDYSPTIEYKYEQIKVGGTNSGNAGAQIKSWNRIINFLKFHFPLENR